MADSRNAPGGKNGAKVEQIPSHMMVADGKGNTHGKKTIVRKLSILDRLMQKVSTVFFD